MANVVGSKGQMVIEKEIRDRLGVGPGWFALQRIAGDHVEVYFVPPTHGKSLMGSLSTHVKAHVPPGKEWEKAKAKAWKEAAREKVNTGDASR